MPAQLIHSTLCEHFKGEPTNTSAKTGDLYVYKGVSYHGGKDFGEDLDSEEERRVTKKGQAERFAMMLALEEREGCVRACEKREDNNTALTSTSKRKVTNDIEEGRSSYSSRTLTGGRKALKMMRSQGNIARLK